MTLRSSACSSSRSYLSPAASLTSCTRSSTTAAFHAERSGSVRPRRKVTPVSPTRSASFAASVRSCGPLPPIGSVDDPSALSESEILDNQETDEARKGCGHQRIHGLIPNQPTEGIAESRRDDHIPEIPASHRNLKLRGRGALLVTVPSFSKSTSGVGHDEGEPFGALGRLGPAKRG